MEHRLARRGDFIILWGMLTFTSLGGGAVRCIDGGKAILAFPSKPSGKDINLLSVPEETPQEGVISWPGEYDLDQVAIRGIGHDEGKKVSYSVEVEGVRCAFLSSPLHDWSDHELELLGDVDVLCIPADDVKLAQKIIDEVDPRVLIPLPTKNEDTFSELLRVCGAQGKESQDDYKLKSKASLPMEGREVVILTSRKE